MPGGKRSAARLVPLILASILTAPLPTVLADTSGWPHLRGPGYDGASPETGLLDNWPDEGPLVLWTFDVGEGYSGCCARGGRVYTQMQTLYGQYVVCLEGGSGRPIWEHRYDWPFEQGGMYPGPRATPTWHDGRLYIAGARGDVHCLLAEDGEHVWTVSLHERFQTAKMGFGYSCSPLVEQGKVILPLGGPASSLVALDARNGATVWASGDEPGSYCSALPITLAGRRYVVAFLQNALASFELDSGRRVWQHKYSQGYDEHAAFPLYAEPYLLIACPFKGGSTLYRLETEAAPDGGSPEVRATLVRQSKLLSNDTASSVLLDGCVYGFDLRDVQAKPHRPSRGEFKCLDLLSGDVHWSADDVGHATVLAADGKLILFNDRGEVLLARATPESYQPLGRTQVFSGEICWTPPALDGGRLYVRSPSRLACLLVGRPEQLSPTQQAIARPAADLPQPVTFDVTRLIGGERMYPFDAPSKRELKRWYLASLATAFAPAGLLALIAYGLLRRHTPVRAAMTARLLLFALAFVAGIVATPLLNRGSDEFTFTWPASLFAAWQLATWASVWSRSQPGVKRARRLARLAGVVFLAAALAYFHFCWKLGMAIEWVFLIGLPLSSPMSLWAAFQLARRASPWRDALWLIASFSVYYLACAAFVLWKMGPGA